MLNYLFCEAAVAAPGSELTRIRVKDRSAIKHVATIHCFAGSNCSTYYLAHDLCYLDLMPEKICANLFE